MGAKKQAVPNPDAQFETITPALAKDWLENTNYFNRAIRERYVIRLARDMEEGKWNGFNGESISFDEEGRLADGQHRLSACVKSGVTIQSLVVRNVPRGSYFTKGIGAKKSFADFLFDEHNTRAIAGACWMVYMWKSNNISSSRAGEKMPTIPELEEVLRQISDWSELVSIVDGNAK